MFIPADIAQKFSSLISESNIYGSRIWATACFLPQPD
jgi:hypothetical protein